MSDTALVFTMEPELLDPPQSDQLAELGGNQGVAPQFRTEEFVYPLRGFSLNPIVDASSSLLGLLTRLASLQVAPNIDHLHKDVSSELESLELELTRAGYDRVTVLAHRYCLCSALDEAIMATAWGQDSDWAERSLLAMHHSETWGGEKFFIVLNRLLQESHRYHELLEFLYLLLCLGFEGKYSAMHNGRAELEEIISSVHHEIRQIRGESPQELVSYKEKIFQKAHKLRKQTPTSIIWILLVCGVIISYLAFYTLTETYTDGILEKLRLLLTI